MEEVGANLVARCSFCGATAADPNSLVQGGGPGTKDLPVVQICAECVAACAEALQIERRIGEARASQRPPDPRRAESGEIGAIRDWTPFSMEGKSLEWKAERLLKSRRKPLTLINVRVRGGDRAITLELDGDVAPNLEHAVLATEWLSVKEGAKRGNPAESAELGVLQDWAGFEHGGRAYEWRAERVPALRVRPVALVSVRNPATGEKKSLEFDPRVEPSVDEAVMVASVGQHELSGGEDDELPDAVVT
jgi:hypothetical protein